MIKELVKEIQKINDEAYNSVTCQLINILEIDYEEGTLYLDFNDKLSLKITYNGNKRFIKFEILKQDERFWSKKGDKQLKFKCDNKIVIQSGLYLDVDFINLSSMDLLGERSLINDGVTNYLLEEQDQDNYYIERLRELFIALLDWSYNAPEFNVKEEVKSNILTDFSEENVIKFAKAYQDEYGYCKFEFTNEEKYDIEMNFIVQETFKSFKELQFITEYFNIKDFEYTYRVAEGLRYKKELQIRIKKEDIK